MSEFHFTTDAHYVHSPHDAHAMYDDRVTWIRNTDQESAERMREWSNSRMHVSAETIPDDVVEPDESLLDAARVATDFVSGAANVSLPPDVIFRRNETSKMGEVRWQDKLVMVNLSEHDEFTPALREKTIISTIVHEKAHTIPSPNHRAAVSRSTTVGYHNTHHLVWSGLHKVDALSDGQWSYAFEEAFADSYVAEYRASRIPGVDDQAPITFVRGDGLAITMPYKYFEVDKQSVQEHGFILNKNITTSTASFFAHSMEMLGEIADHDLIEVLRTARSTDEGAPDAARLLARTLNSIEPGLYKKFRDCAYEEQAAIELHVYIAGIRERHFAYLQAV